LIGKTVRSNLPGKLGAVFSASRPQPHMKAAIVVSTRDATQALYFVNILVSFYWWLSLNLESFCPRLKYPSCFYFVNDIESL
jgi:hypothetical protein